MSILRYKINLIFSVSSLSLWLSIFLSSPASSSHPSSRLFLDWMIKLFIQTKWCCQAPGIEQNIFFLKFLSFLKLFPPYVFSFSILDIFFFFLIFISSFFFYFLPLLFTVCYSILVIVTMSNKHFLRYNLITSPILGATAQGEPWPSQQHTSTRSLTKILLIAK